MRRVSWLSILAVLFAVAGCATAAVLEEWAALAVCLTVTGTVLALLSLRETR